MGRSEKRQYIFTVIITLVALIGVVTYNLVTFYSNAVSDMLAIGKSSLAQEREQLDGYLTKGMDVLQVTAITVEYMMQNGESPERIEAFLKEESERYMDDIDVNFTGVYGYFQGRFLDGSGWEPDADYVPQEREWYIAAEKAEGKPTIVSPYLDEKTGTIMISVSQLLYDGESVISFDIVLDQIQVITKTIKLGGMGYGFVMDRAGLVVAHSDAEERGKNYREGSEENTLFNQVYTNEKETFRAKLQGEDCTVFTDTVMNDWYVVMIVSNTKLYHDIRIILLQNITICLIVFGLIVWFLTLAFRKIGVSMKNAEESRQNLETMNVTIMRTIARTIDAKDKYTNGHSRRVAKYAGELAKRLGKSRQEQKDIYYAALLHDVGKIHIPDAIINKPARLTDEEFSYIKLHPVIGYYILRDIKGNAMIPQGAKWHHERFDGNGYPNGLAGENIPEVARIIGVADAYDAMTSNRSYRQVMSQARVREEIEKGRGTQFDPEIADVMLGMIDEDKEYEMRQKNNLESNILVVDDDMVILNMIEYILKKEPGYNVRKVSAGEEALRIVREDPVDLVFLDVQMPGKDGFEVYEEIRKISDVPIVFLAEDKSIDAIDRASALEIEDYLVKPFMPQALLEIVHTALQEKLDI